MFVKYLLLFSLTAFVILFVTLTQNPNSSESSTAHLSDNPNKNTKSALEAPALVSDISQLAENKSYFETLLNKGLTKAEAQLLVFYKIKQRYLAKPSVTAYWEVSSIAQPIIDTLSQAREIRAALLAEFGDTARENPLFKEVFYPFGSEADYMSSADQIALFEAMAEQQAKQTKLLASGLNLSQIPDNDPTEVLSKQSAYEWKLRKSYLAERLRASEVIFSEQSFRKSYALLAPIYEFNVNSAIPNASDFNMAISGLETLLGKDDAIRVQASLDPGFTQFKTLAQKQNLSPDQVITAFGIVLQAENELMQAYDLINSDEKRAIELMNQARLERDNNLSSFIGAEAAQLLITAYETPTYDTEGI